jgi:8-oxo-dGTP diphosphatase
MAEYIADFCPACGAPTRREVAHGRERPVCTACAHVVFFDPKVAVVAFITSEDRVLLIQRDNEPGYGLWSLPGGFVDAGEHPEAALQRELLEETRLKIGVAEVLGVFHDGSVITIAYAATIAGGTPSPADDAAAIGWFAPDHLPPLAFTSTITLIDRWKNRS